MRTDLRFTIYDLRNLRKRGLLFLLGCSLFFAHSSQAVCPVCTVAVGAGIGLSRYLGIDDMVTGVWIGGMIMSLTYWTIDYLNRKNIRFKGRKILTLASYMAVTLGPLYYQGIIGHPYNQICGMDKLLFGMIWGAIGFVAGNIIHGQLKKRNNDKVYFPFQKVVMSIAPLVILSLVLYIVSKC